MKRISKILCVLVEVICLGIGVIYSNSISLKENSNTVADSGTDIGTGASAITVRLHGLGVINTGLSSFITLNESLPLPIVVQSNVLNLTPGKTYILVFDYVTTGPKNKFRVDLYPDSLPEIEVEAKYPINHVQWDIKSNSNDMKNCRLRFFDSSKNDGDKDISISSIKLLDIDENKTMTYRVEVGLKFGSSLPTISKDGYVFGWYTSDGTQIKYDTVVTDNMHNLDLYPRWEAITVSLNKTALSLGKNKSETLVATVKPNNAPNKTVTWTSSNTSVATVDSNGKVTGKTRGSATITAKNVYGRTATCIVKVAMDANPITIANPQTLNYTYSATNTEAKSITTPTSAKGTITYSIKSQPLGNYFTISGSKITMKAKTPAGNYKLKVLVTAIPDDGSTYDIGTKEIEVTAKVNKANNSVAITSKTYTFDGSSKTPTITTLDGTPTVSYYSDSGCTTSTNNYDAFSTGGAPRLVGTYYAIARVNETTNYKSASSGCKKAVVINVATGTANVYYNGDDFKAGWGQYFTFSNFKDVTVPTSSWNNVTKDNSIVWTSNNGEFHKNMDGVYTLLEFEDFDGRTSVLEGKKNGKVVAKISVTVKKGTSKIIIDDNGQTSSIVVPFGSTIGSNFNSLPQLTKTGYKFMGYMKTKTGILIDSSNIDVITNNVTLYPQWFRTSLQNGPGFREYTKYESSTLRYWIEYSIEAKKTYGSSNIYLTHVWIKDPSNQIKIAQAGGTTLGSKRPVNLIQGEVGRLNYASKGLISINASYFGDSNYRPWKESQSTPVIIHEGKILRDDTATTFENGKNIKWYDAFGITRNGLIKIYKMPYNSNDMERDKNTRIQAKEQMVKDGVKYSGAVYTGITSRDYNDPNDKEDTRVALCVNNRNMYTLIIGYDMYLRDVAKLAYDKLDCSQIVLMDGGASASLVYKKPNGGVSFANYNSSLMLPDMLYFVEK